MVFIFMVQFIAIYPWNTLKWKNKQDKTLKNEIYQKFKQKREFTKV